MSKQIKVGAVTVGGGAPIAIQSMCNTKTEDVKATVAQIHALEQAGCEIIRVAVPDMAAADAIGAIKKEIHIKRKYFFPHSHNGIIHSVYNHSVKLRHLQLAIVNHHQRQYP